eukprot:COSAG04_NODE_1078_length_8422_cov_5.090833_16_plen_52_part_01
MHALRKKKTLQLPVVGVLLKALGVRLTAAAADDCAAARGHIRIDGDGRGVLV